MPQDKRTAQQRGRLPATEAAALAALSVSESLMLAMVESGSLDPHIVRRSLLDVVSAHDKSAGDEENTEANQAIHAEVIPLIDSLLQQLEAVVPSRLDTGGASSAKADPV